jgi:hypothetical protein
MHKELIRVKKETLKHVEAFETYYQKGSNRSLRDLADELGVSYTSVFNWSKAFSWGEKIKERDAEIAARVKEKSIEEEVDLRSQFNLGIEQAVKLFLDNLNKGLVKVESIQDFERLGKLYLEFNKAAAVEEQSACATSMTDEAVNFTIEIVKR